MMLRSFISSVFVYISILHFIPFAYAIDKLPIFVSIAPQKYFVEQIGKDLVDVRVMVRTGADVHTFEPRPQQMVAISRAKLYFAIGIEFEKANLDKIISTNPKLKVVHLDHGIQKMPVADHHYNEEGNESHGKGGLHEVGDPEMKDHSSEHGGLDPHIWLSPPLVKLQARRIFTALQEIDPSHRSTYQDNYRQFVTKIEKLDNDLKKIFRGKQGLQFMVFHPAWGYFAHAYGLEQIPIEVEGKNPKPAQLKELIEHARERNIKVIFVQPQFSARNAELVAREIGGQVAFADPLAEAWLANLREVAEKFKMALR
jgi:zinc transport system substrate-binding protein